MDKIITYNFSQDFISCLADYLKSNFLKKKRDLARIAVVFGGKRPALFLKRELSRRIKSSYFPPQFFSMDEFIKYIVAKDKHLRLCSDLDAAYLIYNAARLKSPEVLQKREEFADFLPWARQIAAFIDELDMENILKDKLKDIQASAGIGYEIPDSINKLLMHIMAIIEAYHDSLRQRSLYSRGLLYKDASQLIPQTKLLEFDKILFCNFYYLHCTEEKVIKQLFDADKAILLFQKDNLPWSVFERLSEVFGRKIEPLLQDKHSFEVKIYKGFDTLSQVGLVRGILKNEVLKNSQDLDKTLILLSDPDSLIPLLSEIAGQVEEFNVSMGYPLKRSSLYSLLRYIFTAQATRKDSEYYTRDYLAVLMHPLIKNLLIAENPALTRILLHKVEEMFLGMAKTSLSGSLFVSLNDIEASEDLYRFSMDTMLNMEAEADIPTLKKILTEIHQIAFRIWENVSTFSGLISCLEYFSDVLLAKSFIGSHPLNLKVLEKIFAIIDELKSAEFKDLSFPKEDIFKILESRLNDEKVSFQGSPLKGLQILGLLETRALTFENVIIVDANENVLPKVTVYEPLIPRQIMEGLGLGRLKQEEEIQRYHFMRLVRGAKKAYFVYDNSPEKEKSRFLEEIIWQRQKQEKTLKVMPPSFDGCFNVSAFIAQGKEAAKKTPKIIGFLAKDFEYSASSIDDYLSCPLKFYFQHVLHLREKEDLLNEPEAKDIGNFMHNFLDQMFSGFLGKEPVLDTQFKKQFFAEFQARFAEEIQKRMGSEAFMVREIMVHRLNKFLENERLRQVKSILSLEERQPAGFIKFDARTSFKFKYRIDRIDLLSDDSVLVLDYKTGFSFKGPAGLVKLEGMEKSRQAIRDNIHSFQLPIYCYFTRNKFKDKPLNAALYNLRSLELSYFIDNDNLDTLKRTMELCLEALGFILAEIISPQVDFYPDKSDERSCQYCAFSALCR